MKTILKFQGSNESRSTESDRCQIIIPIVVFVILSLIVTACKEEPKLSTKVVTSIGTTTATGGGGVIDEGTGTITEFGVEWSKDPRFASIEGSSSASGSYIDFTCPLTGLTPGSSYYVRAYAAGTDGDGVGNTVPFASIALPAIWQEELSYSSNYWPSSLIFTDSLNIWLSLIAIPDLNPVPDLPVKIIKSSNGGISWSEGTIPGTNKLNAYQLSAIDASTAWIAVKQKGLYKTNDGGATWNLINQSNFFIDFGVTVHFFDEYVGVGRFGGVDSLSIIRTIDGGQTWTRIPYSNISGEKISGEGSTVLGNGPMCALRDTIGFYTTFGRVFMSYDRGSNWQVIDYSNVPPYEQFMSLAIISSRKFALVSRGTLMPGSPSISLYGNAKVIVTENGGTTWLPPVNLSSIKFGLISAVPHCNNIYVVTFYALPGKSGGTYISKDGGRTFESADSLNKNIGVTAFYSRYHGFGASFNGNESLSINNSICRLNSEGLLYKKIWK